MQLSYKFVLLVLQLGKYGAQQTVRASESTSWPSQKEWNALSRQVQGRLFPGVPLAEPCFTQGFNSSACRDIRAHYLNGPYLADHSGAYIQSQWGACQVTGEQCSLSSFNVDDATPTLPPNSCQIGSVPQYFIDVRDAADIQAAFRFSRRTRVPLVVKNTGHDYKGRSSAPGSLGLWTHNLNQITYNTAFVPEGCKGCTKTYPGVTMGAGVQWKDAYAFANENNITLVGGSDRSVGATGGWLQGGGHSVLSNTMGLGVDRVLEFKVVTPDGKLRVANSCKNEDLFYALRGGGGGTFGVVTEATTLASPVVTLQGLILTFTSTDTSLTREMWTVLTDNGLRWADEGWGGFSMSQVLILVNPVLSKYEAEASLQPVLDLADKFKKEGVEGLNVIVTEYPSFDAFFEPFASTFLASMGIPLSFASRLIPKSSFKTSDSREELLSGLLATNAGSPGMIILITAPSSYKPLPGVEGRTSVTEAWRDSVYHITAISEWDWNATKDEMIGHYRTASQTIDNLRRITPDAAYLNEADIYEPNWQQSFWGSNYEELLQLKKKFDPDHLLDCWQCVGWQPDSPRFSCYFDL